MRASYLPKFAVAILVVAAAIVILSGQSVQVAASPSTPASYCYYGYYNSTYYYMYPYYYYYGPYYYCSYSYYGHYYYSPYYYSYYSYPYDCYYYNYYYYNYCYGSSYSSTPSKYDLSVATDPSNLGTVTGGGSYTSGSSASFSITQAVVQPSSNTRYVFSHWGGDYSGVGSSGTVTMNGAKNIVAVYQLQYYLSVNAYPQSVPAPQGSGWYNAEDTAPVVSPSQTIVGDSQSRLVFQGWNIDGKGTQSTPTLSVKMDAPHSATALYKQQYYLTVSTDQGVPYGQGWYDAGSTAQIFVSTPASTSYGVSNVFNSWQGDIQSSSQSASVLMDKPKTVVASWRTDSTVLYVTIALAAVAALLAVGIISVAVKGRQGFRPKFMQSTHTSETHTRQGPQHEFAHTSETHTKKKATEE